MGSEMCIRDRRKETHDGKAVLLRGTDDKKDQSYYLFTTTQEQLNFIDFPLGTLKKAETRQLAKDLGLHLSQKAESFDICFVPKGDYRAVVKKFAPEAEKVGNIILKDGTVMGQHEGVIGYTVGQRKGLGGGFSEPMYVTEIRADTNEVVIGPEADLHKTTFTCKELNWLGDKIDGLDVRVKVRAQHEPVNGRLKDLGQGRVEVTLFAPERQISPGQAAVFYDAEDVMLGGGWIEVPQATKKAA